MLMPMPPLLSLSRFAMPHCMMLISRYFAATAVMAMFFYAADIFD